MTLEDERAVRVWLTQDMGLSPDGLVKLERLEALLRDENRKQNLVAAASLDAIWIRHFADSIQLIGHVSRGTLSGPWLDLGSGAGFPGLAIAIALPLVPVVLVESRRKRIEWLERARLALALPNVEVIGSRLETVETFGARFISGRAFAPLERLVALSARFSTPETTWLLPKGRGGRQELAAMPKAIRKMFHVEHSLTDPESAILVGRGSALPGKSR